MHQEYFKYLKEVEKYVLSIDQWLRVFQTLSGSLKGLYKLKTLNISSSESLLTAETLKRIKAFAQELFLLSSKAKKIINNEAVNLFNKPAVSLIEQTIEFLNLIYFNLANFLEFDFVFKEFEYKFVLNKQEFAEAFELFLKFEEEFKEFLKKITKARSVEIEEIQVKKISLSLRTLQEDYQREVSSYFEGFDLKIMKKLEFSCRFLNHEAYDELFKEVLDLKRGIYLENPTKANILFVFKELYRKTQEIYDKLTGIEQSLEFLKKMEDPDKYEVNNKKKLNKIIGLGEIVKRFEEMGFVKWVSFLGRLKGFLEMLMLKKCNEKEMKKKGVEEVKNLIKSFGDYSQKEILKEILKLLSQ